MKTRLFLRVRLSSTGGRRCRALSVMDLRVVSQLSSAGGGAGGGVGAYDTVSGLMMSHDNNMAAIARHVLGVPLLAMSICVSLSFR